jgi:hypothetical protein
MEKNILDTKHFQKLLEGLYDDLTDCVIEMVDITKVFKEDSYLKKRVLRKEAQEVLPFHEASLKDLLEFWMPLWKEEGRIHGRQICLGAEAILLGFDEETKQDVYDVCKRMICLFD